MDKQSEVMAEIEALANQKIEAEVEVADEQEAVDEIDTTGEKKISDLQKSIEKKWAVKRRKDREKLRASRAKKARRMQVIKTVFLTIFFVILACAISYMCLEFISKSDQSESSTEVLEEQVVEEKEELIPEEILPPEPEPVSITITAVGDCTLGTDLNYGYAGSFMEMYAKQGGAYFFEKVRHIFEEDDITLINLEGPLTDVTTGKADKQFAFRGESSYVDIMTSASVEAANLANNHSKDYGTQGHEDTKMYLSEAGVSSFGYEEIAYFEVEDIKVALVGVYALALGAGSKDEVITRVSLAKEEGADLVITSFHWGVESSHYPESYQTMLAETAIDYGSDLVLGHHPHCLQGMDEYNGKYIIYSLGNFSFGGNKNPSDKDTIIYQQTFTFLEKDLTDTSVNIIPSSISSVTTKNDFQPVVATGSEKTRIAEKFNTRSMIDVLDFIS